MSEGVTTTRRGSTEPPDYGSPVGPSHPGQPVCNKSGQTNHEPRHEYSDDEHV